MKAAFIEKEITPPVGVWLDGFAGRSRPSDKALHPLFLRVMALADEAGTRVVIVTADIALWPKDMTFRVKLRAERMLGLPGSALLMSASLNHSGPVLARKESAPHWPVDLAYVRRVEADVHGAVASALDSLSPCRVRFGVMRANVGIARRMPDGRGGFLPGFHANENAPADPDIPVLAVYGESGKRVRGLWYGVSSHPTCLTAPEHYYGISSDFPGAIARRLKARLGDDLCPLFSQRCGGDLKTRFFDAQSRKFTPASLDALEALGDDVAARIVAHARSDAMRDIHLNLAHADLEFPIPYQMDRAPATDDLLKWAGEDAEPYYRRLWAQGLLERMRTGSLPGAFTMHASRIRLAEDLNVLGLAGGVVSGMGRMVTEAFGRERTIFMGYCSYGGTYVPTSEMIRNGSDEAVKSITWTGHPAPFVEAIDDIVLDALGALSNGKAHKCKGRSRAHSN